MEEDVQQLFDWARKNHFENIPHEFYQTINKDHGRIEIRRYWLLESVEHLIDSHLWSGLKRVGLIESERRVKGKPATIEQRYYLLSLDGGVERFAHASRSHWGIEREGRWGFPSLSNHAVENQLHWCLDVAFNEDNSRIRSGYAPENMTLIRHIALNLLAQETSLQVGKKAKRLKAGWDDAYLSKVLAA
jgi:predicted transposase YbfD/YdcC